MGNRLASFILSLIVLIALCGYATNEAASIGERELKLKAGFVVRFLSYVKKGNDESLRSICVYGDDSVRVAFEPALKSKTSRPNLSLLHNPISPLKCEVVFISEHYEGSLASILRSARGNPILTIGDGQEFLRQGGMIRFFEKERKLKFEVNLSAATREGLFISSQLLRLALMYKEEHED